MTAGLPADLRRLVADRWQEATDRASREARWVKQCDLLETWLQSREYLAASPDLPMASFAREIDETPLAPSLADLRSAIAADAPEL
jgi:5'-deoxynucleotidase YfbR-like HD superfamily hydrolase